MRWIIRDLFHLRLILMLLQRLSSITVSTETQEKVASAPLVDRETQVMMNIYKISKLEEGLQRFQLSIIVRLTKQ